MGFLKGQLLGYFIIRRILIVTSTLHNHLIGYGSKGHNVTTFIHILIKRVILSITLSSNQPFIF